MENLSMETQSNSKQDLAKCDYLTGLANRRGLYDYYLTLPKESILHAMFIDIDTATVWETSSLLISAA